MKNKNKFKILINFVPTFDTKNLSEFRKSIRLSQYSGLDLKNTREESRKVFEQSKKTIQNLQKNFQIQHFTENYNQKGISKPVYNQIKN